MRRREFVASLAAAPLGLTALSGSFRRSEFKLWVWVHGGGQRGPEEWRRAFGRLRAAGITGALVIGGDGAMLAAAAHAEGLEFHRWIMTLCRGEDAWAKEHAEWFSVNRNGESSLTNPPYVGYYHWLCPSRPEVREYVRGIVTELARDPAVDGVHLDYIRHPDVILPRGLWAQYKLVQDREYPQFDYCYCEVCRAAFRGMSGADPLDLPDPTQDLAWRRFRWDSVTGVVRVAAEAVHAHRKPLTAAVFATPTLARQLVRQAWDEWPLDAAFPMLYHRFYDADLAWIGRSVAEGVAALPAGTPLHAGLFLPDLPPAELGDAVRIVRDAGASGATMFEMEGLTDEHLVRLRETASP